MDPTQPQINVEGARREFRRRNKTTVQALADVSFSVKPGEFAVLLGPSGCGKSTLLRSIAGLEHLDAGSITLAGRTVADTARGVRVPTEARKLSMMFQTYALWPHMTVEQNVAYPLRARNVRRQEVTQRVSEILEVVGIKELATQHPGQISGGQAQRVALARALVSRDEIVLFDEPLSNVDAKVRQILRAEIARLHRDLGFTAVYVTHDQEEAMTLATRILVMKNGQIVQEGSPRDVYERPASRYVAQFMGTVNELPARVLGRDPAGRLEVETPLGVWGLDYPHGGEQVTVLSRPEAWTISDREPIPASVGSASRSFPAVVNSVVVLGSYCDVEVSVDETILTVRTMRRDLRVGDHVQVSISRSDVFARPTDDDKRAATLEPSVPAGADEGAQVDRARTQERVVL